MRSRDGNKKQQVGTDHIGDCGTDRQTNRQTDSRTTLGRKRGEDIFK